MKRVDATLWMGYLNDSSAPIISAENGTENRGNY